MAPSPTKTSQHPAVRKLIAAGDPDRRPRLVREAGVDVVLYTVPRFTMSRRLVEMLGPNGIVLQRIAPTKGKPCWLAMTRAEFEAAFATTLESISWEFGYYTWKTLPDAAARFVVP